MKGSRNICGSGFDGILQALQKLRTSHAFTTHTASCTVQNQRGYDHENPKSSWRALAQDDSNAWRATPLMVMVAIFTRCTCPTLMGTSEYR